MCGISCFVRFRGSPRGAPSQNALECSLESIVHRGPDSRGIYISDDCNVGLGHVRLSIIDLATGQQPLHSKQDGIVVVVTGEIYDHERVRGQLQGEGFTFETASDSEIALHLYRRHGPKFLPYLRGEFALVLYDPTRNLLFIARDRFGIKPLYWTVLEDGILLVASEIKAFPALGWRPKWDVKSVLESGVMFDQRTVFEGVEKVPAAHYSIVNFNEPFPDQPQFQRYWDAEYPQRTVLEKRTLNDMIEGVRERLFEAVQLRLRADVPYGVYLSGGIDSACILGIATHILRQQTSDKKAFLHAFTLAFPDVGDYDEGPIAERMAAFCGAQMHVLRPSEAELVEALGESIWHAEMPAYDLNAAGKFLLSKAVRELGYPVVLTGEGADEHFAGYSFFLPDYLRSQDPASASLPIPSLTQDTLNTAVRRLEMSGPPKDFSLAPMSYTDAKEYRALLGGISTPRQLAVNAVPEEVFTKDARRLVGKGGAVGSLTRTLCDEVKEKIGEWHPLHTALYAESHTSLPNLLCRAMGDATEMAHSIEGRPPFLDHKLAEYVNSLPPSVKICPTSSEGDRFIEKWILREAVKPYVTEELYARTKHMYLAPVKHHQVQADEGRADEEGAAGDPSSQPLRALMQRTITEQNVRRLGWAEWGVVKDIKDRYLGGAVTGAGGLSRELRILLNLYSFIVLAERFGVPPFEV